MKSRHVCPKCGGTRFITVAHVMQDWEVDEYGNHINTVNDCLQVSHEPDDGNYWNCVACGAEAIIVE